MNDSSRIDGVHTFWRRSAFAVAVICGTTFPAFVAPANAQDAARLAAGREVFLATGCDGCHGLDAGGGAGGEQPAGPSLRRTRLAREDFVQTIACGRPGTAMPFNMAGAYVSVPCWGLPLGPPPAAVNQGAALPADKIEVLADYLMSLR